MASSLQDAGHGSVVSRLAQPQRWEGGGGEGWSGVTDHDNPALTAWRCFPLWGLGGWS